MTLRSPPPAAAAPPRRPPVLGWFAVGFALLGIFTWSIPFLPLALVLSVIALLFGQWGWGTAGFLLAVFGVMTSPFLMGLIGLGAFVWLLDLPSLVPSAPPPSGPTVRI